MKGIYFDCNLGAAGDMITAALLELTDNPEETSKELNAIGIPDVEYFVEKKDNGGIVGTHVRVRINGVEEEGDWKVSEEDLHHHHHHHDHEHTHEHHHHHDHEHRSMDEVVEIIMALNVSPKVKENAVNIYKIIAEAESKAHGHPVTEVHFHEVGKMDAIADVVGACYLLEKLAPERIISSPIAVGTGYVKCAHGVLPVPAPATANILQEIPIKSGIIPTESCTPTGAAILKYFAEDFTLPDDIKIEKIGYGIGSRTFPGIAGGLRAFICEL